MSLIQMNYHVILDALLLRISLEPDIKKAHELAKEAEKILFKLSATIK